jgi:hypothetical protein
MAKRKRITCPYCGERAEQAVLDGKRTMSLAHQMDCPLALCDDPRTMVKDCPAELIGISHGMAIDFR